MRHRRTPSKPVSKAKSDTSSIKFADIEALVIALGGEMREGAGSRVALLLGGGFKRYKPYLAGLCGCNAPK